jgi:hypothetical protein
MAPQPFTHFGGSSYVAASGHVGPPVDPLNVNNPTFQPAAFPAGMTIPAGTSFPAGGTIHGADVVQSIPLSVTAVTTTALTATIPAGAIIKSMTVYTTTAFTGNTNDVTLAIGNAASGAQYVAAVNISAIGVISLTLVGSAAAALLSFPSGSPNLFLTLTQAANATAVGAGTLVVTYTLP